MPLFEYRCKKCQHLEEVLQKASDPGPAKCPECNAKKSMEKEVSLTSFQLKGGGWYKDLYSSVPADSGKSDGDSSPKADKSEKADKADKPAKADKGETKTKPAKKESAPTKKPKSSKAA